MDPAGLRISGLILMYTGFFGFLGSAILFIFKGFDKEGKTNLKRAITWLGVTFAFFILWIVGLMYL